MTNSRLFAFALVAVMSAGQFGWAQAEPVATAVAKSEPVATAAPATAATASRPVTVTVQLHEGHPIEGTLVESNLLQMKSSFGDVSIPLSEVAGIKLAGEGNATTTIVLHNGDSVTGAVKLDEVTVQTTWGKAEINGGSISSLLFAQGVKWTSSNTLSGTRWSLTAIEGTQGASGVTSSSRPGTMGQTISSQSSSGSTSFSNGRPVTTTPRPVSTSLTQPRIINNF